MRGRGLDRMPRVFLVPAMALLLFTPVWAGQGDVNFLLGRKDLDTKDWGKFDRQPAVGVEVSFGRDNWPIRIAIDQFDSNKDNRSLGGFAAEVRISELCVGVRKVWGDRVLRPYVGGGLAIAAADIRYKGLGAPGDRTDEGVGGWVGGGLFWRLGNRFNLGSTVRYSTVDITSRGSSLDAGGLTYALTAGFGWPKRP